MQRIYNYGSSLQAYSLRRLFEDCRPDVQVSFLDYEAGATLAGDPTARPSHQGSLARNFAKLREYNAIDAKPRDKLRFFNHKRSYPSKYFPLIGISAERNREFGVDLQVIGSDEVFNCVQDNSNVGYSRELFGHDSPARLLASYAGSFGNTTLAKIEAAGIREQLAADFSRFSAISVRDRNSSEIVTALTGTEPEIHLDPTLVHELESEARIPSTRQHSSRYIIVYGYSGRFSAAENRMIRAYANQTGARVLSFGGLQASADEYIDCDPFTLLAYFRDAEAVVTDTFHGTIFSIINEVPFATVIRRSNGHGYGNQEKLGYLLEALGLSDRALQDGEDLGDLINRPIDYASVRAVRARERARAVAYVSVLVERIVEDQRK